MQKFEFRDVENDGRHMRKQPGFLARLGRMDKNTLSSRTR